MTGEEVAVGEEAEPEQEGSWPGSSAESSRRLSMKK
jgi:hypothetical protein